MPAKRAYGMDQEFYSWSPIVTRPVLRWPDNARVALVVIVNLEHWDWEVPEGTPLAVSPMGGPEGIWMKPTDWSSGVEGTLATRNTPRSGSSASRSVNVPHPPGAWRQ